MELFTHVGFIPVFFFVNVSDFTSILSTCKDASNQIDNNFYMRYWVFTMKKKVFKDKKRDYKLDIMRHQFNSMISLRKMFRLHLGPSFDEQLSVRIATLVKLIINKDIHFRRNQKMLNERMEIVINHYKTKIEECRAMYTNQMKDCERWHMHTTRGDCFELMALRDVRERKEDGYLEAFQRKIEELGKKNTKKNKMKIKSIERLIDKFKLLFHKKNNS